MSEEAENFGEEDLMETDERIEYGLEKEENEPAAIDNEQPVNDSEEVGVSGPEHAVDPDVQRVVEHVGGSPEDWEFHDRGEGGRFDGTELFKPDGSSYTKEIESLGNPEFIAQHEEMLAYWREHGPSAFVLPSNTVKREDGDTEYVTQLILDENGKVDYITHKFETIYEMEDEQKKSEEAEASAVTRMELSEEQDEFEIVANDNAHELFASVEHSQELTVEDSYLVETPQMRPEDETMQVAEVGTVEVTSSTAASNEIPTAQRNEQVETHNAPDSWLVQLLGIDTRGPSGEYDDMSSESHIDQESIHDTTTESIQNEVATETIAAVVTFEMNTAPTSIDTPREQRISEKADVAHIIREEHATPAHESTDAISHETHTTEVAHSLLADVLSSESPAQAETEHSVHEIVNSPIAPTDHAIEQHGGAVDMHTSDIAQSAQSKETIPLTQDIFRSEASYVDVTPVTETIHDATEIMHNDAFSHEPVVIETSERSLTENTENEERTPQHTSLSGHEIMLRSLGISTPQSRTVLSRENAPRKIVRPTQSRPVPRRSNTRRGTHRVSRLSGIQMEIAA